MNSLIIRMNWIMVFGIFCLLGSGALADEAPVFKDQKEKISYGIGVGVARDFKLRGVELDVESFIRGLKDQLSGSKLLISDKELDQTMDGYAQELRAKQEQAEKLAAEENKKAGAAFLAANARKKGIVTLTSGLQYKILKKGKGDKPTETDAVQINYRGTLIDGTEVDSSYRKTDPAIVKMNGIVPGLREAFKLMSPGAKWQIFIPSDLAYGERKVYRIEPNSTLIFEVEMVSILKQTGTREPSSQSVRVTDKKPAASTPAP